MPTAQDCAERLREQAYRTLLPQIRDLEKELQNVNDSLSTGIHQIGQKLEALSHIELPTSELVLGEILVDVTREADLNTNALVHFAQSMRRKETQEEILGLLLDAAHRFFPLTALFAVRGTQYVGWSSRGFSESTARAISSSSFPRSDCPKCEEVLESGTPVTEPGLSGEYAALQFLDEEVRGSFSLVPLRVLDRPVAILLAGGTAAAQRDLDALSMLVEFAVLRLENLSLRILYELTASRRETGVQVQAEPAETRAPAVIPDPGDATPNVEIPAAQAWVEPIQKPEPVFDLESFQKLAPTAESISMAGQMEAALASESNHFNTEPSLEEPASPKPQIQENRPLPEEEKLHSDAKRFARLLVSEIKLYNEHHVADGRENQDLYLRLKRDIDRSREMYEKRVSPVVSRKIDYFHDEIIRILGDNDPSTLGSDYPGPRVES